MPRSRALSLLALLIVPIAPASADDEKGGKAKKSAVAPVAPIRKSASLPAPEFSPESEARAIAFVGLHHPELAAVLERLKPMNPAEYRKAVGELSQVARMLAEVRARNPRRYEVALDAWKAKSRLELLAAQLASAPDEERDSRLRPAVEARLDAEARRLRFDLEQAEAAARKAREALDRLEQDRDVLIEARLRALQPKKKARKVADGKSAASVPTPASSSSSTIIPGGKDR